MSASQSPSQSPSILHELLRECNSSAKRQYNRYASGFAGSDIDDVRDDVLTMVDTCVEFERKHETDRFRTSIDITYVGDDAYPDSQQHQKWQYSQKYDNQKNQFDIIRAQKALSRATSRARAAGA